MQKPLVVSLLAATSAWTQTRVVIDGKLDDAIWTSAQPTPMSADGGEIRIAVAGRYLYVGARMPERTGQFTARSIGRNPHWEEEDMIRVTAGSYPDWTVVVGPLGAWGVETKGVPIPAGNFRGAAMRGVNEWTAEVAMPMNDFRAARPEEITVTIERIRAMRPGDPERSYRWPATGPAGRIPRATSEEAPAPEFRPAPIGNTEPPIEAGRGRASSEWLLWRNEAAPRLPRAATGVQLSHDGDKLRVTARCDVPGGAAPGSSDSFALYLSATGSSYVQIGVDPSGTLTEATGMSGGQRISRPRTDWRSGAHAVVDRTPTGWTAQLDIPLAPVAAVLGEDRVPEEWRVLLVRSRPGVNGELRETSVFPVIETETLVCPARYRRLRLMKGPAPARQDGAPRSHPLQSLNRRVLSVSAMGMIDRHQRLRTQRILEQERREWDLVNSRESWEKFRDRRIAALRESLGEFPTSVPLRTIVSKEYRGAGYRREDLVYQSRQDLWVTANLYLPLPAKALMPAIVIVHSHHRPRTQSELQDMGILWARAGAAVLVMDQMGAGERMQNYPWNREAYHSRYVMNLQLGLAGQSLIQWMVWDIRRGVDLLLERNDIDRTKIGLLGAVAGGGDPAGVAAALDERITMVAPFNYGESTPESPRFMPEKNRWPRELAEPSSGSWEWTRGLPHSTVDQFLPWVVCASVAPRKFVYSFEMGWKVEDLPAWERYRKVFGFYNALDNLDEAHGFGPFPGPGECTNIGPYQRKTLYPELERWFGLAPPEREPDDRRPEAELAALTSETARKIRMKPVHELVRAAARPRANRLVLREQLRGLLGDIEPNPAPEAVVAWTEPRAEGIRITVEPGIEVPMVLLKPSNARGELPVVAAVARDGRDRFFAQRAAEMQTVLDKGIAVCLVDVRGTGETEPDPRRTPTSTGPAQAATELILGNTMLGARLKDLRTAIRYLGSRPDIDGSRIAVWGESFAPPNPPGIGMDELPNWTVGPDIRRQADPLGDLIALLATLYEPGLRGAVTTGGLVSFESLLETNFVYVPQEVIVPGWLTVGDLTNVISASSPGRVARSRIVDGRNRLVARAAGPPVTDSLTAMLR